MGLHETGDQNRIRAPSGQTVHVDSNIQGRAMLAGGSEFPCRVHQINLKSAEIIAKYRVKVGQIVIKLHCGIAPDAIFSRKKSFSFSKSRRGAVPAASGRGRGGLGCRDEHASLLVWSTK